jgi:hypothetical protein
MTAFGFPKPRPRVLDKVDQHREKEAEIRRVNALVDRRDDRRCRCCSRKGNPDALTTLGRIHRAHIRDASRGGEYLPSNLCSLCHICHALEHAKQLWFVGDDANALIGFEIHEAAVVDVFGTKPLPRHVRIILRGA